MKKLFVCALFLLGVAVQNADAQTGVIKVNPLGLLFGNANAGFEYGFSDRLSAEVNLNYSSTKATLDGEADVSFTGIGGGLALRYYFTSKGFLDGLYLSPNFSIGSTSGTSSAGADASVDVTALGLMFGRQWVFGDDPSGFALDLGLGVANYSISTDGDIAGFDLDGILPQARIALGYAF